MNTFPLSQLEPGEQGVIETLQQYGAMRRRLRDLGFLPGTKILCAFSAPAGSPRAFFLKGFVVALRKSDCDNILVSACE